MHIHLDVHLHDDDAVSVHGILDQILTRLRALEAQGVQQHMVNADTKAAMTRIETATTDLGTRITALTAKIGTGMTDQDVADVNTELGSIAANLEGMAKDPENPVPPVVTPAA